ncbi:MAG: methionine adenosyltransferase [Gammaproteobacteria bacterium]|jgi:S-adenosylmethionine synthetase
MKSDFMFTSDSVTEGHPDKLCDQISDAIVDRFMAQDHHANVSAECAVSRGVVFIAARFASSAQVDVTEVARGVIEQVGYRQGEFSARDCTILTSLTELPPDVERITCLERSAAGDIDCLPVRNQVTVFGFACNQTPAMMPLPIWLAHRLARRLTAVRLNEELPYLAPDGKTQVGVEYRNRKPHRIHSITLIASQTTADQPDIEVLCEDLKRLVIDPTFADEKVRPDKNTRIFINPEGAVIGGGPSLHSGLTGRKTAVDTYGEYARHSGAALSGKDPMRIDRIGAYAARYAAKNVLAAGLADECEVQLSYTIGLAQPVSVQVETFGTATLDENEIAQRLQAHMDFSPASILNRFRLLQLSRELDGGLYRKLAAYGQVGRTDIDLPWEQTDLAEQLKTGR